MLTFREFLLSEAKSENITEADKVSKMLKAPTKKIRKLLVKGKSEEGSVIPQVMKTHSEQNS